MKTLVVAVLSIAFSVAAQYSLKAGMSGQGVKEILGQPFAFRSALDVLTDKYILGGFLLYGLGAIVWLMVLSKWDVSKAYPLVGIGFILTVIVGALVGEEVTALRVLGVIMISAGVWLVASS
jgi:multidrug transporter EmrE-like cation transporter